VTYAGWDKDRESNADQVIKSFHEFIEENKDEILALRIIYDQRYADRPMAIKKLKELYEKLQQEHIAIERLWDCYAIKKPDKVKPFFGQKGLVRAFRIAHSILLVENFLFLQKVVIDELTT
ncbi:MAG: hypothetical protein J6E41_07840, partial [Lachnospiraceae bacterium]|nr:hypothetical protein [Lachnospiraceae bacterium]